ncbi:peptidase family C50-domain-containing protein [Scenedesmus sp. NREL 46B-D3]|nr:peptidase family C50-domain-containing protein [Scenedesmus sp. NREL 46B-D3]
MFTRLLPAAVFSHRCPSLTVAVTAATRYRALAATPSSSGSSGLACDHHQQQQQQVSVVSLPLSGGFYLLNPDGDLQATQETFQGWLQQQLGQQGVAGSRPSPTQLSAALRQHQLFLYFGHGGGDQYVPLASLKRLDRCAGSLLMGCSSGRLRQMGLYEPSGAIWGYLLAGCPAAVANLWDVTDRDIDRFAQAVLKQWSGDSEDSSSSSSSSNSSASQRNASSAASSSEASSRSKQHAEHASTARNHNSSSSSKKKSKASAMQQDGSDAVAVYDSGAVSMCGAVAASRQACRLPSLIGAAAVCYGLPAFVSSASLH